METKNPDDFVTSELQFLGYDSHFLVSPHSPGGGGLALLWKNTVSVSIISSSQNVIDTTVFFKGKHFAASFLYGEPDISLRSVFWESMTNLFDDRSTPWIVTGDLNEIINNDEKSGGGVRPESSFSDFRSFMSQNDLFDMRHTGNFLSWRGIRHTHLVHCRLDRTLINSSWHDLFPMGRCHYLRFEGSDHRPLLTMLDTTRKKSARIFRYDRRLKDNVEIKDLVDATWNSDPSLTVVQRLARCRGVLAKWCRLHQTNSKLAIDKLKLELDTAMSATTMEDNNLQRLNTELLKAYQKEEAFWRQRSRILWLTLGDRNTSYFHAVAKGRTSRNRFSVLETAQGNTLYEEDQIGFEIANFFQSLFTASDTEERTTVLNALTSRITPEMNASLVSLPSAAEIKKALFAIHPDKAPGPDGFSASFFQSNWSSINSTIISEVQLFFETGVMPPGINTTHVRLIPKIQEPKVVSDYRPIALCSVYYKIISKILSLRLRPILGEIVSENQSAFLPGRAITDNVLITHEILHHLKNSEAETHCFMAVKTDMSKAYDRLEWGFIRQVLTRLGFDERWTNWIMECVTTVSYSYLVNDSAFGNVTPQRGIRQGDPLSPYLFILCGEVLSGLCRRAQQNGSMTGVKLSSHCPRLNHLLFADDTMFFIKADEQNSWSLKDILQQYELASGQLINVEKSSIFFSSKTPQVAISCVKQILGIEREGGVGKYLGLPELFGRRKRDLFASIVDRIKQKAVSWSSRRLSSAGKLTMLKSVLSAIPTYAMSCFQLPIGLCDQIQSVLTRFWWDDNPTTRKMCWVAWDKITEPKVEGGLGIRDVHDFNVALLAKLSWRILSKPESLLARMLLGKYCKNSAFSRVSCSTSASHGWRSVLVGRDLLITRLGKVIGNGNNIKVWRDTWISTSTPIRPYGPCRECDQDLTVADLLSSDSTCWLQSKVEETLPDLASQILCLVPSMMGAEDSYCWYGTKSGSYSVKSGYLALQDFHRSQIDMPLPDEVFDWQKSVWTVETSPKLKLFLWKLCRGALATGANLATRGISASSSCPHCGATETTLHLFFHCPFAVLVWSLAPLKHPLHVSSYTSLSSAIQEASLAICLPPTGVNKNFSSWLYWFIWTTRNQVIFEQRHISASTTVSSALTAAREWQTAQIITPPQNRDHTLFSFSGEVPPQTALFQTDAAWLKETGSAGVGWIYGYPQHEKESFSKCLQHVSSPLMAEALAMREALLCAKQRLLPNVWFQSDSQELIRAINSKAYPMELYGVLTDIEFLSSYFSFSLFTFIPRAQNSLADALAKAALYSSPVVIV